MSNYYGHGLVIENDGNRYLVVDTNSGNIIDKFKTEHEADEFINSIMEAA